MKDIDSIIKCIKDNGKSLPFFYRYVEPINGKLNVFVRKIVASSYFSTNEYVVVHYYKPIIMY